MYWGLYLLNLGLVFTVKCSITILISFVFHVANEECKYMSLVLWHVNLVSWRFGLPMVDWGLYFSNFGLALYFMLLMKNVNICLQYCGRWIYFTKIWVTYVLEFIFP